MFFGIDIVLLGDVLKHNLLRVHQICDKGYIVTFETKKKS